MNPANVAAIIQAARGPILLITIGVLMVVDYNTPFSFGRTWPALIIVFGLLKLLERMIAPARQPPYLPGVPPGYQPQAGPYPGSPYPPGTYPESTYTGAPYQGSPYEPSPGFEPPPQNPGGNPQ